MTTTKAITKSDVEKRNEELTETNAYLHRRVAQLEEDLREFRNLREEARRHSAEVLGLNGQLVDLTRRASELEGYRQRVEREDELRHGRPPTQEVRSDAGVVWTDHKAAGRYR